MSLTKTLLNQSVQHSQWIPSSSSVIQCCQTLVCKVSPRLIPSFPTLMWCMDKAISLTPLSTTIVFHPHSPANTSSYLTLSCTSLKTSTLATSSCLEDYLEHMTMELLWICFCLVCVHMNHGTNHVHFVLFCLLLSNYITYIMTCYQYVLLSERQHTFLSFIYTIILLR